MDVAWPYWSDIVSWTDWVVTEVLFDTDPSNPRGNSIVIRAASWIRFRYSHLKHLHVWTLWEKVIARQKLWEMWWSWNVLTRCWWWWRRRPTESEKQKDCWVHLDLTVYKKDWTMYTQLEVEQLAREISPPPIEWRQVQFDEITAYYTPLQWQTRYSAWRTYEQDKRMQWDGENASWRWYKDSDKYTHGACWPSRKWYILRIEWRPYDIKCVDRWWAIDNNDIDIYYWIWERALWDLEGRGTRPVNIPRPAKATVTVIWKF